MNALPKGTGTRFMANDIIVAHRRSDRLITSPLGTHQLHRPIGMFNQDETRIECGRTFARCQLLTRYSFILFPVAGLCIGAHNTSSVHILVW